MKISPDDFHYLVNQFLVHMINYDPQRVVKSERSERQKAQHNHNRTQTDQEAFLVISPCCSYAEASKRCFQASIQS